MTEIWIFISISKCQQLNQYFYKHGGQQDVPVDVVDPYLHFANSILTLYQVVPAKQ
jgi:hypothetical protein